MLLLERLNNPNQVCQILKQKNYLIQAYNQVFKLKKQ